MVGWVCGKRKENGEGLYGVGEKVREKGKKVT
jgi:hypothetical protein